MIDHGLFPAQRRRHRIFGGLNERQEHIFTWIAVVVVSRDLVLSVGVLVIHVAGGTVQPAPSWLGKLSTVFQMATVLAAMISFYFGALQALPRLFAWVTAVFTVTSGLQYIMQGLKQINPPPGVGERS